MEHFEFYDREGNGLTFEQWREIYFGDVALRRVALDEVGPVSVSTVWDGGAGYRRDEDGRPLIFETRVNLPAEHGAAATGLFYHWTTEDEARAGHAALVVAASTLVADETRLAHFRELFAKLEDGG